jgi:hypothetical protein
LPGHIPRLLVRTPKTHNHRPQLHPTSVINTLIVHSSSRYLKLFTCIVPYFTSPTPIEQFFLSSHISAGVRMESRRRSSISVLPSMSAGTGEIIFRSLSRTFSNNSHHQDDIVQMQDLDSADADSAKTKVNKWRLASQVKEMQDNDPAEARKLGVTWRDLTVKVMPSDARLQENVLSQFNIPRQIKESRRKPQLRTILDSCSGHVKPGEMLLVLGKPGRYVMPNALILVMYR